jgi:hypothetical protein
LYTVVIAYIFNLAPHSMHLIRFWHLKETKTEWRQSGLPIYKKWSGLNPFWDEKHHMERKFFVKQQQEMVIISNMKII